MQTKLTVRRILTAEGWMDHPRLTIEDGILTALEPGDPPSVPASGPASETLVPCFFDIHFHGAACHDLMSARQSEIDQIGRFLAVHGVGAYLPTTVTCPIDETLFALERLGRAVEAAALDTHPASSARPVGIHLEGPFVSHIKRGVHPPESILEPSIALFDRFQQAAGGHIRLITLAPELPHALELMDHVANSGVRVSLGHTDATAAEGRAAMAHGAASATHTFNAMRALDHREPGILGVILDRDDLFAELICDGIHVDPVLVRLWLKMKGADRAILVTDAMAATGMPDGNYRLGDLSVDVHNGICMAGGRLAGSVLTMDRAVSNLQQFTGAALETAVRLASTNPASMLHLPQFGMPTVGQPADFNCYNEHDVLCGTILRGQRLEPGAELEWAPKPAYV